MLHCCPKLSYIRFPSPWPGVSTTWPAILRCRRNFAGRWRQWSDLQTSSPRHTSARCHTSGAVSKRPLGKLVDVHTRFYVGGCILAKKVHTIYALCPSEELNTTGSLILPLVHNTVSFILPFIPCITVFIFVDQECVACAFILSTSKSVCLSPIALCTDCVPLFLEIVGSCKKTPSCLDTEYQLV